MDPRPPAPPAAPVPTGDWGTAPPRPREPQPGEQIGPYRLVRQIGRGGMAVVFEADDTELPRRVALKVLVDTDPQAKLRFVREAHAQAKVSHDNVVPIYRVGEDRGVSYIAMPVLSGQSLAQALTATPKPPLAHVVRIGQEIAEGLAAAHAAGLIHRDIKPANVWLEAPKWRVKILDFGLVRDPHADTQIDITMQGHVVGTPAYMSPEQAAGQEVNHRTDLWSLGVVLYQMTTGKRPFHDDNTVKLMTAIVSQEAAAAADLAPDLPPKLSDLIRRLMTKNPDRRPATAAAVAAELDAIGKALVAPPVVVVSLPSAVPDAAPSGVSPWSDLEATHADVSRAATPAVAAPAAGDDSYDRPPPRRPRPRAAAVPKWAWIGGGVFAAVLAVGALVLAIDPFGGKSKQTDPTPVPDPPRPVPAVTPKPPKKDDPKPPTPAPLATDYTAEREAAEKLVRFANLVATASDGRKTVVPVRGKLPDGPFAVTIIDFANIPDKQFKDSFVSDTFLPAVSRLSGLERVQDGWELRLSPDHLRRMAGAPLARTLRALEMSIELTPETLAELPRFAALTDVTLIAQRPTDDLFARLAGLTHLRQLTLSRMPPDASALTATGWAAVAGMPLERFTMWGSRGTADALKAFAARRGPLPALRFMLSDVTDKALNDHLKPDTELREIEIHTALGVSNNGLTTLANVKALRALTLNQTTVAPQQVVGVLQNRPDLRITLNGVTIVVKK